MTAFSSRIGRRAEITGMLHSPASTQAWASCLIGRHGTVTAELRNGILALLALDGAAHEMPGNMKRWAVHWDDLLIQDDETPPLQPCVGYRLGLSDRQGKAVQHAVRTEHEIGLCGAAVRPLPTLGWSLPFLPTTTRACPACVRLVESGAEEGMAPAAPPLPSR
ncbi:hypothetical protein [Nonomuraea sp. NPDC050783]|uniref:hypothetical protein n=1 Tax=Nonomuraea sp. NPDC050783 TaxID=3154634 RepID=UPI0034678BCE